MLLWQGIKVCSSINMENGDFVALIVSCGADTHLNGALIFLATDAFSHQKPCKSLRLGNGHVELISMVFPKQAVALGSQAAGPANKCIVLHFSVRPSRDYALPARPQWTPSLAAVRDRQNRFPDIYSNVIWCTPPVRSGERALGRAFVLLFIPKQLKSGHLFFISLFVRKVLASQFLAPFLLCPIKATLYRWNWNWLRAGRVRSSSPVFCLVWLLVLFLSHLCTVYFQTSLPLFHQCFAIVTHYFTLLQ